MCCAKNCRCLSSRVISPEVSEDIALQSRENLQTFIWGGGGGGRAEVCVPKVQEGLDEGWGGRGVQMSVVS